MNIGISQNIKISNYTLEDTLDQNITILLKFCKLLPIPIFNKLVDEKIIIIYIVFSTKFLCREFYYLVEILVLS